MSSAEFANIPKRLPILFIPGGIVLPGGSVRFRIATAKGIALIQSRLLNRSTLASTIVGIVPTHPDSRNLKNDHEPVIGTAVVVVQVAGTTWPRQQYSILVTGVARFKVIKVIKDDGYDVAQVEQIGDDFSNKKDFSELVDVFRKNSKILLELLDLSLPSVTKLKKILESVPSHQLADVIASILNVSFKEKWEILNATDVSERFKKALPLLQRQIEGQKTLQKKIEKKDFLPKIAKNPAIDDDHDLDEIEDLEIKLSQAELPDKVQKVAFKELKRVKKMSPQMHEYPMLRHYLELIADLPWAKCTVDQIDIAKAKENLDADHYALNEVKKRILEFLAVKKLKNSLKGPILCFVGPPGVGKTSIGKSIANTLGRKFHRISLGGISDQSDIRGHRRTYIGSMPGRFIQGLKTAGVNNPVFLLDEIDKMSSGVHGDPSAALLEVLDPEQNSTFVDHYLSLPFDLSQVIFIATANSLNSIPRPLKDRMEIIQIPGYTIEDKVPIGQIHLVPKQMAMHGLDEKSFQIPDESLRFLISGYTLEAGVRDLERKIGALCRAMAVRVAAADEEKSKANYAAGRDPTSYVTNMKIKPEEREKAALSADTPIMPTVIDENVIKEILGHPTFESTTNTRLGKVGVAVGLAWTPVGGEVMVVEATKMKGSGQLVLTGQLGEVMKESATLALSWIRSNSHKVGLSFNEGNVMDQIDIHIHFPEGAISKDGPSAGITITAALVSLFTDKPLKMDLAMTGEITLRGVVLPVGGIKEKVMAAYRSGFKQVIMPAQNRNDLNELPKHIKEHMKFSLVSDIEQVLGHAFEETIIYNNQNLSKL